MSTKIISSQECLVIFAYIKFLASLSRKEEKPVPEGEKVNPEKPHRAERVNRPIKRPRRKLTEVLAQAPEHNEHNENIGSVPAKPHRAERVNRPIKRPRRKLTEVLAQAPEHNEYNEVDTGCPVGNEVW